MNVKYLMAKNEQAYFGLGWSAGGSIDLGYNVMEMGDLWMYIDIHSHGIKGELLSSLNECLKYMKDIFGDAAKTIDFFENEESPSGYSIAVELDSDYDSLLETKIKGEDE